MNYIIILLIIILFCVNYINGYINIEIGFGIDVSDSISNDDLALIKSTFINMLQNETVIPADDTIAVGIWAFSTSVVQVYATTSMNSNTIASAITAIQNFDRSGLGTLTAIGDCIDAITTELSSNQIASNYAIIDIITNGFKSFGNDDITEAQTAVNSDGIHSVNCLGVKGSVPDFALCQFVYPSNIALSELVDNFDAFSLKFGDHIDTETDYVAPSASPTEAPTPSPTKSPTKAPTKAPTKSPTPSPTPSPTEAPTPAPTLPTNCTGQPCQDRDVPKCYSPWSCDTSIGECVHAKLSNHTKCDDEDPNKVLGRCYNGLCNALNRQLRLSIVDFTLAMTYPTNATEESEMNTHIGDVLAQELNTDAYRFDITTSSGSIEVSIKVLPAVNPEDTTSSENLATSLSNLLESPSNSMQNDVYFSNLVPNSISSSTSDMSYCNGEWIRATECPSSSTSQDINYIYYGGALLGVVALLVVTIFISRRPKKMTKQIEGIAKDLDPNDIVFVSQDLQDNSLELELPEVSYSAANNGIYKYGNGRSSSIYSVADSSFEDLSSINENSLQPGLNENVSNNGYEAPIKEPIEEESLDMDNKIVINNAHVDDDIEDSDDNSYSNDEDNGVVDDDTYNDDSSVSKDIYEQKYEQKYE